MSCASYDQSLFATQWVAHQPLPVSQQYWEQPPVFTTIPYHSIPAYGFDTYHPDPVVPKDYTPPPIRRKRASRPKVRTGCIVCKIRRVKCDETKPHCKKCTDTGRKCDGYQFTREGSSGAVVPTTAVPPRNLGPIQVPEVYVLPNAASLTKTIDGTVQERRAFHRFKDRAVIAFAGGSEVEFWTQLVLQAASHEEVIREAVIALGTLHETYELRSGRYEPGAVKDPSHQEAIRRYRNAIQLLLTRIDRSPGETTKLATIASILFTCFEILERNNMAAVIHYQAGMRALMQQIHQRDQITNSDTVENDAPPNVVVRSKPEDDLDRMLRVFARYDIQACTFSKPKAQPLNIDIPSAPPVSIGLTEMRRYLDNLLIAVYQLIKSDLAMFRYWKSEDVSASWHEKRDRALTTFDEWLSVIEKSIPSDAIALRQHGITAGKSVLGLMLQIKIAMIMLRTSIDCSPESSFDTFTPDFDTMVSRVENLTASLDIGSAGPLGNESVPFSMELGVVHPLFYIAWKCRDWGIRRRAITQLQKCGKEGVWEGPIMAVVAERIASIEEQDITPGEYVPEQARIHSITKSCEYDERVVLVELKLAQDTSWRNWSTIRESIPF